MRTDPTVELDIFEDIFRLHEALKLPPLNTMPEGWTQVLSGGWTFVVNGNETSLKINAPDKMPITIQPFHAVFWYHGWIAGDVLPMAGGWLAAGSGANAATLHTAFEQAIAKAGT
jgi:hypothetical protein